MTFVKRKISVQMTLNGDTFDGGGDTLTLEGIRCRATVVSFVGGLSPCASFMQLQIWGMTPPDMERVSTLGLRDGIYNRTAISVMAGDDNKGMSQLFAGGIHNAFVDYNAAPDVSLEITANAALPWQLQQLAGTTVEGAASAEAMLKSICASCTPPLNFSNPKGFDAILSNHAVGGTAFWQIANICEAAGCNYCIVNGTLSIWPLGQSLDDNEITVSSQSGLVGYPMYGFNGLDVVMEYNPNVMVGRKINIQTTENQPTQAQLSNLNAKSSVPLVAGSNGVFGVTSVTHDVSSELPGGPWFTKAHVSIQGISLQS